MMCAVLIRVVVMLSILKLISSRVEFTNFKCKTFDKSYADVECALKAVNRSYKYIWTKIKLLKIPVTKVTFNLGVFKRLTGYHPFLYNVTVDGCKFMKNRKINPILSYYFDFIKDITNMNHSCPFNHDLIMDKLSTMTVNHRLTKVLPFPEGDYMVEMQWIAYGVTRVVLQIFLTLSRTWIS